jgi:hypothetical protein
MEDAWNTLLRAWAVVHAMPRAAVPTDYVTMVRQCALIGSGALEAVAAARPDAATLAELRERAWALFVHSNLNLLCDRRAPPRSHSDVFVFGDLLFRALTRLSALLADTTAPAQALRAEDLAYCAARRMCVESARGTPVLQYGPAQVVDALMLLRNAVATCAYHDEVLAMVELLEMAAARLMHRPRLYDPARVLDAGAALVSDTVLSDHVREADSDQVSEYVTPAFVSIVWPSVAGLHRRIDAARSFGSENVDAPPPIDARWLAVARAHLLAMAAGNAYSDAAPSLRECYMLMHARPGDKELYMLTKPGSSMSDAGIVASTLGDARVKAINAGMSLTPITGVRTWLESAAAAASAPEPGSFGLCMHDLLAMTTGHVPGGQWGDHYSRRARDLAVVGGHAEALEMSMWRPMLVQLFNHWQLLYARRVFWYNSALHAYAAWCRLKALQDRLYYSPCANFSAPSLHPVTEDWDERAELEWAQPFAAN